MTDEELMEYGRWYLKLREAQKRWVAEHRATKPRKWCQEISCCKWAAPGRRKCARHLVQAAERTRKSRAKKLDKDAKS